MPKAPVSKTGASPVPPRAQRITWCGSPDSNRDCGDFKSPASAVGLEPPYSFRESAVGHPTTVAAMHDASV